MKYFVLQYEVVEGFVARRAPYREEHLRLVREAHARGDLLFAGAVGDPPDGALLVFRVTSPDIVEEFARTDPYVRHGPGIGIVRKLKGFVRRREVQLHCASSPFTSYVTRG